MEYEEATSGFVTLYNYKEPFMKFEEGFGFQGVLLMDGKTNNVQCHFCGEWFNYLPHHLHKEHNMTAEQYKKRVGLNMGSALISEQARQNLIAGNLDARIKNLRVNKKHTEATKEKIRKSVLDNANRSEFKNKIGTCPLQLIERLKALQEKLGKTPSVHECNFKITVERVFGSWKEGLRRAGMKSNPSGVNFKHAKYTVFYESSQLVDLLVSFKKNKGRYPSLSDAKRGFLPSAATFKRHFGSWSKAKIKAFPELDIEQEKVVMDERQEQDCIEREKLVHSLA